MQRASLCVLLCSVLSGCGAKGLSLHAAHTAQLAQGRAPIAWRVIGGRVMVTVSGWLGSEPATWAIDTGATLHAVTAGRASRSGLVPRSAEQAVRVTGQDGEAVLLSTTDPISVSIFESARASSPSWALPVLPGPTFETLDGAGVAGLLSPQRLVAAGEGVELDLRHGALFRLPRGGGARARDEVAQQGALLSSCGASELGGSAMTAAVIDGHPVQLVVDTGTPVTVLYADTKAGIAASMRATVRFLDASALGPDFLDVVALVPRVTAEVAGLRTPLRILVRPRHRRGECLGDGLLGLDVLRGCTLVFDGQGGAMGCEALPRGDTAPGLRQIRPLPPSVPLPERAAPLPAGTIARLGCDTLTDSDVAIWAQEHAVPAADAREPLLRRRVLEAVAAPLSIAIPPGQVDSAIRAVRLQHRLDEPGFAESLSRQHKTQASYRAEVTEQLLTMQVLLRLRVNGLSLTAPDLQAELNRRGAAGAWSTLDVAALQAARDAVRTRVMTGAARDLIARSRDRLGRVLIATEGSGCQERWPHFYLEQVVFSGVSPADQSIVRLALATWLEGADFSLGPSGLLPGRFVEIVQGVFAPRGLLPQLTAVEKGQHLHVAIVLLPAAAPPGSRQAASEHAGE